MLHCRFRYWHCNKLHHQMQASSNSTSLETCVGKSSAYKQSWALLFQSFCSSGFRASSDFNRAKLCQREEHRFHGFSSALSELAAELRPAEMHSWVAYAAGLGFAALQSSALLRITARLCDNLQLSSAALHSSALLLCEAQLCCTA